jgi:hypothetical protein
MSPGFGTSARKRENGFVARENCFVAGNAAKQSWQKCELFQRVEAAEPVAPSKQTPPPQAWVQRRGRLRFFA